MSVIQNSLNQNVEQDRNIIYLAGLPNGQSPIGFTDKWNALGAQKHPIMNKTISSITGIVSGVAATTLGTVAYPLYRDGIQATFFAGREKVVLNFTLNKNYISAITNIYEEFFNPSRFFGLGTHFQNFFGGIARFADTYQNPDLDFAPIRTFNYGTEVFKTVYNNPTTVAGTAIAITILVTYLTMKKFSKNEIETENQLTNSLKNRYEKIASRLNDLEDNTDVQECSKRILKNQFLINKEIENLQLPSLNWSRITEITQPVIEVAEQIQSKS